MAMTFTTKPVAAAPAQESFDLCKLDLLNATESLNQAWMDLTDTQREIDGLQEIMDNVTQSVELLSKYGAEAIPMLNQDGGLESLLQIPERLITVEKAMEAMDESSSSVGDNIKNFFSRLWDMVAILCSKALEFFKQIFTSSDHKIAEIKAANEFDVEKEVEITVPNYFNEMYSFRNEFMVKMPNVCKIAESMRDQTNEWCKDQQQKILDEFAALAKKYESKNLLSVDLANEKVHFISFFEPSTTTMKACGWDKEKIVKLVDSYKQNFQKFNSWSQQMKLFALKMKEMKINSQNASDRSTQAAMRVSTGYSAFGMSGYTDLGTTLMSIIVAAEKINMGAAKLIYKHVCAFYACKK